MRYFFKVLILLAIFILAGCSNVKLPKQKIIESDQKNIKSKLYIYPQDKVPYQELANNSITTIKQDDINLYGIKVTKDLEIAYKGYLAGDTEPALKAIERIKQNSKNPKLLWQASFLKIQLLIVEGLGDDASIEIESCKKYEIESFGSNLNCTALKAELNVWLEDYEGAKKEAYSVLSTIGKWEFPTSYSSPPSNMDKLVSTTTAQLRAYTSLAALYNLQENYKESFYWSNEAEKRINSVHYVSNHWLYGNFVKLHLDSYYGRAINLTFLATSKLALGYSKKEVKKDFDNAIKFFNMIDYKKGVATVLALKARVYNKLGQYDMCKAASEKALEYSMQNRFLDFVWRIEAIRGDTFLKLGAMNEAKKAYKRANDTVNVLTSALGFESSKRRFGIGKDDISYNLIQFSKNEKDFNQLFIDLEQSRARAFVDMLAKRTINFDLDNKLLKQIRSIDKKIKKELLLSSRLDDNNEVMILNELISKKKAKIKQLQNKNPILASVVSIWSSSLKDTQNSLKNNESIVYFLPLKEQANIEYLKITKDDVSLEKLNISSGEVSKKLSSLMESMGIDSLLSSLKTRGLKISKNSILKRSNIKNENSIENIIEQLQNKLAVKKIFSSDKTYIVSSGIIHFIPWGMLNIKKEFALLPNGSWLNFKDIKINTENKIVVVANPQFGGNLPQLEGAYKEGLKVAKMYDTKPLTLNDATYSNLQKNIKGGVDILHLATHGIFYKNRPMDSAVFLSKNGIADAISAKKIYENPIKANLVVLSACETGLGKSSSGEDMIGLNRSFFLGGTKTILSSLWPIDDNGTKEFMSIFYKYAKNGDYSKAFLMARKKLKNQNYPPAIYGAFILNGVNK